MKKIASYENSLILGWMENNMITTLIINNYQQLHHRHKLHHHHREDKDFGFDDKGANVVC